jgi:hypothetical protein
MEDISAQKNLLRQAVTRTGSDIVLNDLDGSYHCVRMNGHPNARPSHRCNQPPIFRNESMKTSESMTSSSIHSIPAM